MSRNVIGNTSNSESEEKGGIPERIPLIQDGGK